ncbi:helix-turn-helix transcriptional regulator [Streptomyces sp. BE308]|uniref:helix-turn-helix domain-containing protein n=1 Tax=Streptomyces sp. BE308 TaxID=3002529 RepID=UPI002E76833E|nr:helix-turn-helix transcriptional regulator [Streptomyces sp. BE308]MEE1790798.1 helix-turn-helix transcriptional regulator [Streptomyces sp. BE308]
MEIPLGFGAELRRLRQDAGMTLQQLAVAMSYSKGHLCKIERGDKPPTLDLVRRCDAFFKADGRLRETVESRAGVPGGRPTMARRQAIATGVGSLLAVTLAEGGKGGISFEDKTLPPDALFRDQLHQMRQLGQSMAPATLLPILRSQAATVTGLASRASGSHRTGLLVIASRFAEYLGWMAQEAGDEAGALKWTAQATELARAGGDEYLADYALVRRALVTFYNGRAPETIALAQQAQRTIVPPRIRGLAAQREAQGHALAGDERACGKALDRARALLALDEGSADAPVLGTTQLADPVSMVTGWCLYDLGRPREAATVLDRECRLIAPHALRTRTRFGLRNALAQAASGEIERSCDTAGELLAFASIVPSATVRTDVRRLDREWSRFRTHPAVRDLRPALADVLSPN